MRGLPPVPTGVGRLTQQWETGGHRMTTSWWMLVNLPVGYSDLDLYTALSEYTLFPLVNLLGSMSSGCTPTTCRLAVDGHVVVQKNPPAHGAFPNDTPDNCASGLVWRTGDKGRHGWALTYLPGCPHDFVENGWQLSAEGWGNLVDSAFNFKLQLETLPSFPHQTFILGTLLRQRNAVPLPASIFRPFVTVNPSPKIVTIRRRIPRGPSVLPF